MAKFILIYNQHSEIERNAFNRIRQEMGSYIVAEHDFQEVRHLYPIQQTPALIPILDHLCGEHLLDGDIQLNMFAEATRLYEEEEQKVHNQNNNRLDSFINNEKQKAQDELLSDMLERGVL